MDNEQIVRQLDSIHMMLALIIFKMGIPREEIEGFKIVWRINDKPE